MKDKGGEQWTRKKGRRKMKNKGEEQGTR